MSWLFMFRFIHQVLTIDSADHHLENIVNIVDKHYPQLTSYIFLDARLDYIYYHFMNNIFSTLQAFTEGIQSLTYWDWLSDIHGGLSMLSLMLFGAVITLYFTLDKFTSAWIWLRNSAVVLVANIAILDLMGLFIYRPYREKISGTSPRTLLKADPGTSWLHTIVFEHKEHLAFAPLVIMAMVAMILVIQGKSIRDKKNLKKIILFGTIAALLFLLVVAAEAVLVTKAQPLK